MGNDVMALPQLEQETNYTYADYLDWDEGRWELIDGKLWNMTPAPSRLHQEISGDLFYALYEFFKDKDCTVYMAPFDVRLPDNVTLEDYKVTTVVQPDIFVICDQSKLDDRGCVGSPDLIIEILSPSTAAKDLKVKRALYEKHGVQEYWLVHPTDQVVMSYQLDEDGQYGKAQIFDREDILQSVQFEELKIQLSSVFQENQ
jgi:Uma2 family endonuclease